MESNSRIEIDVQQFRDTLLSLRGRVEDMKPVFADIGERLLIEIDDRFASASDWDGDPWAENSVTTLARYLAARGGYTKKGNLSKKGEKLLAHKKPLAGITSMLRQQNFYDAGSDYLVIGNSMIYAGTQQFGAKKGQFGKGAPWGDIPARRFLPIDDRGELHSAASTLILGVLEEWLSKN